MAMIDYGAIVRKDGVFLNKNAGLFMDVTGMNIPEKVLTDNGRYQFFKGDHFVCIGEDDKNENGMWIGFYKEQMTVVYNKKIIDKVWLRDSNPDKNPLFGHVGVTYDIHNDPKNRSMFVRNLDPDPRNKYPNRFLVAIRLGDSLYEVIFGYGIDPGEDTWNRIKHNSYEFTDPEREIIDSWFGGA